MRNGIDRRDIVSPGKRMGHQAIKLDLITNTTEHYRASVLTPISPMSLCNQVRHRLGGLVLRQGRYRRSPLPIFNKRLAARHKEVSPRSMVPGPGYAQLFASKLGQTQRLPVVEANIGPWSRLPRLSLEVVVSTLFE